MPEALFEYQESTASVKPLTSPLISIVIPVLNEAELISEALQQLLLCTDRQQFEVIVVDGGSRDDTATRAKQFADKVIVADAGRARQMNIGAHYARSDYLLFLHIDTELPANFLASVRQALQSSQWGFFKVQLRAAKGLLKVIEFNMNLRSRITSVATGDQCLFIQAACFRELGGFPSIPLMEDVAFSKLMRKSAGKPAVITTAVTTSSRRWYQHGVMRTMVLMWCLRLKYFLGVSPEALHRNYYR